MQDGRLTKTPGAVLGDTLGDIAFARRAADGHLTIWAKGPRARARLRDRFGPATRIVLTDVGRLERASTLAEMSNRFGSGDIVYDPSGVATRAGAVVRLAAALRAQLGDTLQLALFDAERRRVTLVLRRPRRTDAGQASAILLEAQAALGRSADDDDQIFGVLFTFSAPHGRFVPVDRISLRRLRGSARMARIRKSLAGAAALAAAASFADPVLAQETPAQFGGEGGTSADEGAYAAEGKVSFNGPMLNFQFEGMAIRRDGLTTGEIGTHLYRRDPDNGLVGLTARWNDLGPDQRWQVGVEAERYNGPTTLLGEIGYEEGPDGQDGLYANAGIGYYPTPASSVYLVAGYTLGEPIAQASIEVQPASEALPGLSLFADGGVGVSGEAFVTAGLRFTFGSGGSLIDRDRRELIRRRINPLALAPDSQS